MQILASEPGAAALTRARRRFLERELARPRSRELALVPTEPRHACARRLLLTGAARGCAASLRLSGDTMPFGLDRRLRGFSRSCISKDSVRTSADAGEPDDFRTPTPDNRIGTSERAAAATPIAAWMSRRSHTIWAPCPME